MNDDKHPYVADEKIYIESIDPINVCVVKMGNYNKVVYPLILNFLLLREQIFHFIITN